MKSLPANVRATHVATRWQNRVRIMAACARVALPFGVSVAALVPVTRPSALAQRMASTAQEPACAASVYFLRGVIALVLGIAVQNSGKLLPGNGIIGPEQFIAVSRHNAVHPRPVDCRRVVSVSVHILEGVAQDLVLKVRGALKLI